MRSRGRLAQERLSSDRWRLPSSRSLSSTPLSLAAALFLAEVGPKWAQSVLQPAVELFVGIPSVVYGWVGLSVLVPFIRNHVGGLGFSLLAGAIVLSVMSLPTITTVATDALKALPVGLKEASFGLGATRWQTIWRVLSACGDSGPVDRRYPRSGALDR